MGPWREKVRNVHSLARISLICFIRSRKPNEATGYVDTFFSEMASSVQREYKVIKKVFPNPMNVMQQMVQRIFEQRVSQINDITPSSPVSC